MGFFVKSKYILKWNQGCGFNAGCILQTTLGVQKGSLYPHWSFCAADKISHNHYSFIKNIANAASSDMGCSLLCDTPSTFSSKADDGQKHDKKEVAETNSMCCRHVAQSIVLKVMLRSKKACGMATTRCKITTHDLHVYAQILSLTAQKHPRLPDTII